MRVVEAPAAKQQEDRQDDRDRRQETLRQHPEGEMLPAGIEAGKAVGHHRAHGSRKHRRRGGDDQTVDETLAARDRRTAPPCSGRGSAAAGNQTGGDGQIIAAGLDRGDDDPIERHEHEDHEQADHQERARTPARKLRGAERRRIAPRCHHAASARSRRRTSTMITTDEQNQEYPAARRRYRQMELLEADLVEIEGSRVGRRARSAAGQHEDDVEQLDRIEQAEGERRAG